METKETVGMYENAEIKKVVLNNGGLKGCNVVYEKVERVGGREFINTEKPESKYPIHLDMEKCFGWLKKHLLNICGYDWEGNKNLLEQVEVTGVQRDKDWFVIIGKIEVYDNGKVVSLVTPKTGSDEEYMPYADVMSIIDGIFAETKVYLSKKVVLDDIQLVLKFHKGDNDFDKESFKRLPEREQKEFATKVLEKMKSIVIHEEDIYMGEQTVVGENKEVGPFATNVPVGEEELKVGFKEIITEEDDLDLISEEIEEEELSEDDFDLGLEAEPVKVSIAKKK